MLEDFDRLHKLSMQRSDVQSRIAYLQEELQHKKQEEQTCKIQAREDWSKV